MNTNIPVINLFTQGFKATLFSPYLVKLEGVPCKPHFFLWQRALGSTFSIGGAEGLFCFLFAYLFLLRRAVIGLPGSQLNWSQQGSVSWAAPIGSAELVSSSLLRWLVRFPAAAVPALQRSES